MAYEGATNLEWLIYCTMLLLLLLVMKTRETRERGSGVAEGRRECQSGDAVCQTDSIIPHTTIILILTAVRSSNLS